MSSDPNLPAKYRADGPHLPATGRAADLIAMFLAGRKPTTLRAYGGDLDDFAAFIKAGSRQSAVELLLEAGQGGANAWALAYRHDLVARELAPATVGRRLAALRSVVKLARTIGRVSWSLDVESPRVVNYRDTRGPGRDGWWAMLDVASSAADSPKARRDLAIVRLLHDRGLRRGEVVGLDLADFDADGSSVSILGKGRSQKERLTVGPATVGAIRSWVEARGDYPGPLFTPLDPGANRVGRLTGEAVRLIVAGIARQAGVGRIVRPHGLRHQAVTAALDSGRSLRDVARFSRHRDLNVLQAYDDNRRDIGGEIAGELEG